MIVAICAVVVGLCALGVSFYQTLIMREQQRELSEQRRAEMWPNVEMGVSNQGDTFRFLVVNTGIGPARIRSLRFDYNNTPIQNWDELIKNKLEKKPYSYQQSQMTQRVLPPGEIIEGLVLEGEMAQSLAPYIYDLNATICYCSIYDDCWEYSMNSDGERALTEVAVCITGDQDFLQ